MNTIELLDIIASGETSKVQFKLKLDNQESIAAEMIAMSNSIGGIILFGVEDKKGTITGLDYDDLQSTVNKMATIANDLIKPSIYITTEVVLIGQKKILIVYIYEGTNKPYKNNSGVIWVKQGSDKRKLTDNNEQIRLFQKSGILYADEMIVPRTSKSDIDLEEVKKYVEHIQKNNSINEINITDTLLRNLAILRDDHVTLGGLLFFAAHPQIYRPAFCIKAVSFFGNSIGGSGYNDSRDIEGTIPAMFKHGLDFFKTNLRHLQADQNFNSVGQLEISEIALEETLQNALVHRDYSRNSPIRIMIFDDRVEIISPGSLPNSLTVENILLGNAVVRNNRIVSYSSKLMPYRGFGSGITRAAENQPDIQFFNDVEGEQFIVKIPRPTKS